MFYTYLWLRYDGTPYYVGKGTGRRGIRSTGHGVHCPPERERIIIQQFETEKDALWAEEFLIGLYGRKCTNTGPLRNLMSGGENSHHTESSVEKVRLSRLGTHLLESTKEKLRLAFKERIFSQEWKDKISAAKMGHSPTAKRFEFCRRGHALTPDNRYEPGGCIICAKERAKRTRERLKCTNQQESLGASLGARSEAESLTATPLAASLEKRMTMNILLPKTMGKTK
jgi:hypothetical protein